MPQKIAQEMISHEYATYVLAEIAQKFDEAGLQDAIKTGLVVPVLGNFPRAQEELGKRGLDASKIFLIPHRRPDRKGLRPFHNRTLLFTPSDNSGRHYAFKGVGTNEFISHRPSGRPHTYNTNYSYKKGNDLIEMQFWGGARHVSNLHSAKWSRAAIDELAKMRAERDPALAVAEKYGAKINIMNPYAIFRPLQIPIMPFTFKGKVMKVEHSKGMELSGIPESFAKGHTILAYTAPVGAVQRLNDPVEFNTIGEKNNDHRGVGAGMGLILHVIHDRMKLFGGEKSIGTIVSPNNVSVEPNGSLSFFDFDTINDTSRKNRINDLGKALYAIQLSVHAVYVKRAIIAMLDVYTEGMGRKRMYQVGRDIGKAGKFVDLPESQIREIKKHLKNKMPPREGIRGALNRLLRKHP